ncbi:Dynamin-1 [Manis pentadactyla]|nr:Dynamin-1 [Manis pentadactyla]
MTRNPGRFHLRGPGLGRERGRDSGCPAGMGNFPPLSRHPSPRVWLNKGSAASASGLRGVGWRGGGGEVPRPLRGEPRQVRTAGRGQSCRAAFRARARAFSRSPRCGSAASSDPLRARPHFPSPPPPPLSSLPLLLAATRVPAGCSLSPISPCAAEPAGASREQPAGDSAPGLRAAANLRAARGRVAPELSWAAPPAPPRPAPAPVRPPGPRTGARGRDKPSEAEPGAQSAGGCGGAELRCRPCRMGVTPRVRAG